jgi:hypothetical protein
VVDQARTFRIGYQGSETSRAEAIFYTKGEEPILRQFEDGRRRIDGSNEGKPSLVGARTNKVLGGPAGTFELRVKAETTETFDLSEAIVEDDWVDIVFTKHGRRFHVMRGLVDTVRVAQVVSKRGVTTTTYLIAGRDFQKIFEITPIWFDTLLADAPNAAASRIFAENSGFFNGPVNTTVNNLLAGFLEEVAGSTLSVWSLPASLPNTVEREFRVSRPDDPRTVLFVDQFFTNDPPRGSPIYAARFTPGNNTFLWPLALQYSDPSLVEVYCDLAVSPEIDVANPYFQDDVEVDIDETTMAVFCRDRPFPTFSRLNLFPNPDQGPWFTQIPEYRIVRQQGDLFQVGRSGADRRNAFFAAPLLTQEVGAGYFNLIRPLADPDDIRRHGFRRMDVRSIYFSSEDSVESGLFNMSVAYRELVRDYHCLNPLFLNGTIRLGYGRPDIHVGGKLIVDDSSGNVDLRETYYVEGAMHEWSYNAGLRTTLTATRGWVGSESTLLSALSSTIDRYQDTALR